MKSYQAKDARLKMREILTAAEHGERVEIKRYETVTAVVVSPEWYLRALKTGVVIDHLLNSDPADVNWRSGMSALRDLRDHVDHGVGITAADIEDYAAIIRDEMADEGGKRELSRRAAERIVSRVLASLSGDVSRNDTSKEDR